MTPKGSPVAVWQSGQNSWLLIKPGPERKMDRALGSPGIGSKFPRHYTCFMPDSSLDKAVSL